MLTDCGRTGRQHALFHQWYWANRMQTSLERLHRGEPLREADYSSFGQFAKALENQMGYWTLEGYNSFTDTYDLGEVLCRQRGVGPVAVEEESLAILTELRDLSARLADDSQEPPDAATLQPYVELVGAVATELRRRHVGTQSTGCF